MDNCSEFVSLIRCPPALTAVIEGNRSCPDACGIVELYQGRCGVYVVADIKNLPCSKVLGFHIFETRCSCLRCNFCNAGNHFDVCGRSSCHPWHSGDLPPLFTTPDGSAFAVTYTERFNACDVLGKIIGVNCNIDDFTTQPFGGYRDIIAAGRIRRC